MLDEKQLCKIKDAEEITKTDYQVSNQDDLVQKLMMIIEDLVKEHQKLERDYLDLRDDLNYNYQPKKFDPYEEYGISPHDFY